MSDSKIRITFGSGLSFGSILFFIFLILKLCHVIDWSWWWVTAPLWITFGLSVLLILMLIFVWAAFSKW